MLEQKCIDESIAKQMIDAVYDDELVVGYCSFGYDHPEESELYELNVAPLFIEMVDRQHVAEAYSRLFHQTHDDVWLHSWYTDHSVAFAYAKSLSLILGDWTTMRWLDLATSIASGKLNEFLTKSGYGYLCRTPLPTDDPDDLYWL